MMRHTSAWSDEALVAAFQRGDERAFELLVQRHQRGLVRFAAGFLGVADAEDVVQEALLRAHLALLEGKKPVDPKAWLYLIVRNVGIDAARARSRRPTAELQDVSGELREEPANVLIGRQRFAAVIRAIGALPPRQRDALVDVELRDRSYEDVALAAAVSPSAVKSLVNRARVTVRNASAGVVALPPLALMRLRDACGWLREVPELVTGAALGKAGVAAVSALALLATVPHLHPGVSQPGALLTMAPPARQAPGRTPTSVSPVGRPRRRTAVDRASAIRARASTDAMSAMRDCADGRPLGQRYTSAALLRARRELPTDISEYTSCDSDLRAAILRA